MELDMTHAQVIEDVRNQLNALLALFLPEVRKSSWAQELGKLDVQANDLDAQDILTMFRCLKNREDNGLDLSGADEQPFHLPFAAFLDYEHFQTDTSMTAGLIGIWLFWLASALMNDDQTLSNLDDDMWPRSVKGMLDQFFSFPHLPPWEDVSELFRKVRLQLHVPPQEKLPSSAIILLYQYFKK